MDWAGGHLHEFVIGRKHFGEPDTGPAVEKILPPDPGLTSPICVDGANACPPENVGRPPGYNDFLEGITDSTHEEHEAVREWCGGVQSHRV
jgi:hypothetical protein